MNMQNLTKGTQRPYIGSAAWGRLHGGRLTGPEQVLFALQTVYAQLKQSVRHASRREQHVSARFNRIDLARIALPDTSTVMEALDLVHRTTPDWVCRHTLRTWSWAMIFSQIDDLKPDHETLAVSCLLHDLALTQTDKQPVAQGCACFAIEGATRAGRFLSSQQWDHTRIHVVEAAICLHMNPEVTLREGVEAHLLHEAAALDVVGARLGEIPAHILELVLECQPREHFKSHMAAAMQQHASACPSGRTAALWRLGLGRAIRHSGWT